MIIGNGLVANAFAEFRPNENIVIFASGVSNSKETDSGAFEREINLLNDHINRHGEKKWVYFSTCSITDTSLADSKYIGHKLEVERIIQSRLRDYVIFRVSNAVGQTSNPYTVMNYLVNCISNGEEFRLWESASRNFIDIDDVVKIVSFAVRKNIFKNEIVNVANPHNISVVKLVDLIEKFLGKKAICIREGSGGSPVIDISSISEILESKSIEFGNDYAENLLGKYYSNFQTGD
jgi:nucleoside-diphosphate-sugar epimerase